MQKLLVGVSLKPRISTSVTALSKSPSLMLQPKATLRGQRDIERRGASGMQDTRYVKSTGNRFSPFRYEGDRPVFLEREADETIPNFANRMLHAVNNRILGKLSGVIKMNGYDLNAIFNYYHEHDKKHLGEVYKAAKHLDEYSGFATRIMTDVYIKNGRFDRAISLMKYLKEKNINFRDQTDHYFTAAQERQMLSTALQLFEEKFTLAPLAEHRHQLQLIMRRMERAGDVDGFIALFERMFQSKYWDAASSILASLLGVYCRDNDASHHLHQFTKWFQEHPEMLTSAVCFPFLSWRTRQSRLYSIVTFFDKTQAAGAIHDPHNYRRLFRVLNQLDSREVFHANSEPFTERSFFEAKRHFELYIHSSNEPLYPSLLEPLRKMLERVPKRIEDNPRFADRVLHPEKYPRVSTNRRSFNNNNHNVTSNVKEQTEEQKQELQTTKGEEQQENTNITNNNNNNNNAFDVDDLGSDPETTFFAPYKTSNRIRVWIHQFFHIDPTQGFVFKNNIQKEKQQQHDIHQTDDHMVKTTTPVESSNTNQQQQSQQL